MGSRIKGNKGGEKKPYNPVESPDNLRSIAKAKMLLALGEGEFQGTPTARDIYLDDTPLQSPSGGMNFQGVTWEYRSGSVDQEYIKGTPSVENEFGLNYEVKNSTPYVRAINNISLSAVRVRLSWPQLITQKSNGDVNGSSVEYAIDVSTDGGAYVEMLRESVVGKTTTKYERSRRVNLPNSTSGWQIRVRRITGDSGTATVQNSMYVSGVTEIVDAKLRYPNTALLYIEFDSAQFQNIPKVSVRIKGRGWPVPSNYDPLTRYYSGIWDGTFKTAWTDNPVWIGYGLMVHERFGLGKRIKQNNVDKWEMYRIAQYCDQLVSNGDGGLEPRFTCNMYIQSRSEAWTVLRDLAAIYRGMTYWSQSKLSTMADMPRDIDFMFSRSNVIDGKFSYSGSSERDVYTRAIISYDDPNNMYNSDTTAVSDISLQKRYGDNLLELTAIGCTRQSEAQRRGKWALYTNSKNRTVVFRVGLDGNIPSVGHIIGVADQLLSGRPTGGRISEVISDKVVVLDRESQAAIGDTLILNLPSGVSQSRTINSVTNGGKTLGVTVKFSEMPEPELQWGIDSQGLAIQQYRVTSIKKDDNNTLSIEGISHNPSKYAFVDDGARLEERPITVIPPSVQSPPTNVLINSNTSIEQTMAVTTLTISWDAPDNAMYYDVEWRKDDRDWVTVKRVGNTSLDIVGVYSGSYVARVRAYNSIDVSSIFATSTLTNIVGKAGMPPEVVGFTATPIVFGIKLKWSFPEGALDTAYTEIFYSESTSFDSAILLGNFAYPLDTHSLMGLSAGKTFYFWARLVDKTGNIGNWSSFVIGQSSNQAEEILDYLTGEITETQLGSALLERIDSGITQGQVDAAVEVERLERESADNALAGIISTVEATANGATVTAQEALTATADISGDLSAMWSVKLQVNTNGQYEMAGIGLGIENVGGTLQSQFLVRANRFAVLDDTGEGLVTPFIVQGGQTIISDAVIGNASINFAKISDTIQSDNYVTGVTGWRLQKNGLFEINAPVAGQGRVEMNNRGVRVYDNLGNIRVKLGDLT